MRLSNEKKFISGGCLLLFCYSNICRSASATHAQNKCNGEIVSLEWQTVGGATGYILDYTANPYQGKKSIIREIVHPIVLIFVQVPRIINTVYLLEINETNMAMAKGSTSAIAFTTK